MCSSRISLDKDQIVESLELVLSCIRYADLEKLDRYELKRIQQTLESLAYKFYRRNHK